jgi:phosphopentomutase
MIKRVILIVMDSVGVGHLPDAGRFNDDRADTLLHIYQQTGGLGIPNLCALGIGQIAAVGCKTQEIIGCYGKMAEQSPGKDTTTGHWEIAGLVLDSAFPTYPNGFPEEIIAARQSDCLHFSGFGLSDCRARRYCPVGEPL